MEALLRIAPCAGGKATIELKGGGAALPSMDVGVDGPVRVPLRSTTGKCRSSGFMPIISTTGTTTRATRRAPTLQLRQ